MADLTGAFWVCIPTAVARNTSTSRAVEASSTAVTLLPTVSRETLVTNWKPFRVRMTGASGGGVGAGTGDTGVRCSSTRAAVEFGLTLLTVGSISVVQATHTHTRLWVAVVSVVVALARLASRLAEAEEAGLAVITLRAVHTGLAHTCPRAVADVVDGPEGVTAAGKAASGAVGEMSFLAVLTL